MNEITTQEDPVSAPDPAEIYLEASVLARGSTSDELKQAIALFESIPDYHDSLQQAATVRQQYLELRKNEQSTETVVLLHKLKQWIIFGGGTAVAVIILLVATILIVSTVKKNSIYKEASQLMAQAQYEEAIALFTELEEYKDAPEQVTKALELWELQQLDQAYEAAMALVKAEDYAAAIDAFQNLGSHKDSPHQLEIAQALLQAQEEEKARSQAYASALALLETGDDEKENEAYTLLSGLGQYKDVPQLLQKFQKLPSTMTFSDSKFNTVDYSYQYTYDEYGRVATELWTPDDSSHAYLIEYTYNNEGKKIAATYTYPNLKTYQYTADLPISAEYIYDASGRLIDHRTKTFGGDISHNYYRWYDIDSKLLSQELSEEYLKEHANGVRISILENRMIDAEGKLLWTWAQNVGTDGTISKGRGQDTFYEYDDSGLLTRKQFYFGSAQEESVAMEYRYAYDSDGNLTLETETSYPTGYAETEYTYQDGLLTSIRRKESGTVNGTTEYQYIWVYTPGTK